MKKFTKITAKTAIILAFCFFILTGCQATDYLTNVSEDISGKVQLEQQKQANKTLATVKCQELCQDKLANNGHDFNAGPCLSETIIEDWSCDMAHSPRIEVDDNPDNQCSNFRHGTTHHFVEVDGNCNVIKVY